MTNLRERIARAAYTDSTTLLQGETGTGKELVARALHAASIRRAEPFVAVNCGAIPRELFEAILFGHEKGAFTGAHVERPGEAALAGEGTLFLDEVAEIPLEQQSKLLRLLENRAYRPLGARAEIPFRARVVAATHASLLHRVRAGSFREDLYYRLDVLRVAIPPLRERTADIPELFSHFLEGAPRLYELTPDALRWLCKRAWPGNVRELRNLAERVIAMLDGPSVDDDALASLDPEPLVPRADAIIAAPVTPSAGERAIAAAALALPATQRSRLDRIEDAMIELALERTTSQRAAAKLLGIDRNALARRLRRRDATCTEPAGGRDEPG